MKKLSVEVINYIAAESSRDGCPDWIDIPKGGCGVQKCCNDCWRNALSRLRIVEDGEEG